MVALLENSARLERLQGCSTLQSLQLPGPTDSGEFRCLVNLEEHHNQSEKREGLDKGQAEYQEQKDAGTCAGVAGKRFDRRTDSFALTQSAQPCGQTHGQANANRAHVDRG